MVEIWGEAFSFYVGSANADATVIRYRENNVHIGGLTARPRFTWNGLVDIDFDVDWVTYAENYDYPVSFSIGDKNRPTYLTVTTDDGQETSEIVVNGTGHRHVVWDAEKAGHTNVLESLHLMVDSTGCSVGRDFVLDTREGLRFVSPGPVELPFSSKWNGSDDVTVAVDGEALTIEEGAIVKFFPKTTPDA